MKTYKLSVHGMHCPSCEILIERSVKKVLGVHSANVNRRKNEATIECEENVSIDNLQAAIEDKGYSFIGEVVPLKKRYLEIGAFVLIILAIYIIFKRFEILPTNFGVTENMSYGFILILGILAGTSTCLAVAGGLLLAIATKYSELNPTLKGFDRFRPHIWFNVGRILAYTLLGAGIGLIGSALALSETLTGIITLICAILMILIGLQLLHIFPWFNRFNIKLPKSMIHKLSSHDHTGGNTSAFLFGGVTFFLPCGFTQALQLYVLQQGSWQIGALTMLAFSLGTLPALAGIGAISSFVKGNIQRHFMTFAAVLVILLGILVIPSGLTLINADKQIASLPVERISLDPNVKYENGKQIVEMKVNGLDYEPASFRIVQGIPVEWRIDGTGAQGCARALSVPRLNVREILPSGIKTINFMPDRIETFQFTCSMGMAGPGRFEVVPNTGQVCDTTISNCL